MYGHITETHAGHRVSFERTLPHSVERVWTALTDPDQRGFSPSPEEQQGRAAGWHCLLDDLPTHLDGLPVTPDPGRFRRLRDRYVAAAK